MPPVTLAFAKNVVRRALTQLVDPSPKRRDVDRLWTWFDGRCAYCERTLDRARKEGHVDHLDPASDGGRNHLANRVLSCAPCNEEEKRDLPWRTFLRLKVSDPETHARRAERILAWQREVSEELRADDAALQAAVDAAAREIAALIDRRASEIRALRDEGRDVQRASRSGRPLSPPRSSTQEAAGATPAPAIAPTDVDAASGHSRPAPRATYEASRLTFKADVIEALGREEEFRVVTPDGTFQMSRDEFEETFANVAASESYRVNRTYNYSVTPRKAFRYRLA